MFFDNNGLGQGKNMGSRGELEGACQKLTVGGSIFAVVFFFEYG